MGSRVKHSRWHYHLETLGAQRQKAAMRALGLDVIHEMVEQLKTSHCLPMNI